jgi:hypothetical protein
MTIQLTKTNYNKLNSMIEDEATLNKVMGIISKEAVRQAKMMIKEEKKEAKQKALVLKKEAEERQKSIEEFKSEMAEYVNAMLIDEFGNIVIQATYPITTKWYFENLEGRNWNKVRKIKYNALKDKEQTDERKEFLKVFKSMNILKKFFLIKHLENNNVTMDLKFAKDLKSKRANLVDEMIWDLIQ